MPTLKKVKIAIVSEPDGTYSFGVRSGKDMVFLHEGKKISKKRAIRAGEEVGNKLMADGDAKEAELFYDGTKIKGWWVRDGQVETWDRYD